MVGEASLNQIKRDGVGMTSRRTRERLIQRLREQGIKNESVLDVIVDTPRHWFVDEAIAHRVYEDTPLPIGHNQTISQPYTVARMTELLLQDGTPNRVLEVGTGSGYQTAILAQMVNEVFSVERIEPLQRKAAGILEALGLKNIHLTHTDGGMGLPELAPFDAIIVTAAPEEVPESLLEQLVVGGCLVIPVGGDTQQLQRIVKTDESSYQTHTLEEAKFVPLVSGLIN
ncbi:MAG: protein-L-isoaspartate(D-aspartate) O-methyltransferase [Pontibacterium sp.]